MQLRRQSLAVSLAAVSPSSVRVNASGEIDLETADQFVAALSEAPLSRGGTVIVDLAGVEFLAAVGVGVLVRFVTEAARQGVAVEVVCERGGIVATVLALCGVAISAAG